MLRFGTLGSECIASSTRVDANFREYIDGPTTWYYWYLSSSAYCSPLGLSRIIVLSEVWQNRMRAYFFPGVGLLLLFVAQYARKDRGKGFHGRGYKTPRLPSCNRRRMPAAWVMMLRKVHIPPPARTMHPNREGFCFSNTGLEVVAPSPSHSRHSHSPQ